MISYYEQRLEEKLAAISAEATARTRVREPNDHRDVVTPAYSCEGSTRTYREPGHHLGRDVT